MIDRKIVADAACLLFFSLMAFNSSLFGGISRCSADTHQIEPMEQTAKKKDANTHVGSLPVCQ
jgi:hypothetical protein